MRKINAAGAAIIKDYEGYRDHAYQDGSGLWTCGWGHTGDVDADTVCTPEIAESWFDKDCGEAEQAVCDLVKPALADNEFSALCSFTYNVGREQLETSTLLRKLNAGDMAGVAPCMRAWVFVNGKVALGLVRRRAAESALWSMP